MPISTLNLPDSIDVNCVEALGDVPSVTGLNLRKEFDKDAKNLKEYLQEIVPILNQVITQLNSNTTNIATAEENITDLQTDTGSEEEKTLKVYKNYTDTDPLATSPQIRFVLNTAPTASNYGAALPVGSIVFVY